MEDFLKVFVCAGVAVVCFTASDWVPGVVGTKVPCSDEEEMVQYEDDFCSGATPDCPSHWEAWDSLPPTTN